MIFDSIQIIIPVFNEGESIVKTLEEIESKINAACRIFIVYDFEEDSTLPAVEEYVRRNGRENLRLVKNRYGRGALSAIRTGFDVVGDGVVLVMMADSSDDLVAVDPMLEKINQGYDVVCGSRYIKGGRQIGGPKIKRLGSRMIGLSLHIITGIPTHDITNNFKMYRKSVLDDISIESSGGFEVGMEIVTKAFLKGYQVTEVPSIWRDRTAGQSRFKIMKWLPGYLRWYLNTVKGRIIRLPNRVNE